MCELAKENEGVSDAELLKQALGRAYGTGRSHAHSPQPSAQAISLLGALPPNPLFILSILLLHPLSILVSHSHLLASVE